MLRAERETGGLILRQRQRNGAQQNQNDNGVAKHAAGGVGERDKDIRTNGRLCGALHSYVREASSLLLHFVGSERALRGALPFRVLELLGSRVTYVRKAYLFTF